MAVRNLVGLNGADPVETSTSGRLTCFAGRVQYNEVGRCRLGSFAVKNNSVRADNCLNILCTICF